MSSAPAAEIADIPHASPATPAELFGPLLAAVQERALLADGKTFVDAVARRPAAAIMADFANLADRGDDSLLAFVNANFDLPAAPADAVRQQTSLPLRAYIRQTWSTLARPATTPFALSSLLPVDHPHLTPGGRFREMYYWDSFFSLLGLVRDGELTLARGIVDAMTDLIERFGYVPNGTRTYYLGRSQPPVYFLMVALLGSSDTGDSARRLTAMKREHAWWMTGAKGLELGQNAHHVARLADGSVVNRYWDPRTKPRDESWGEDVATAHSSARAASEVYRSLRAGAESGWDFSSRWFDGSDLGTIRTATIAPVDLNALLFGLESAIAERGDADDARHFGELAAARREAMNRHFWNPTVGYFTDYDLAAGAHRPQSSAAMLAPLLVGAATQEQADATARFVRERYLARGGLRTTLVESGQQWDQPNGWAPLQWIGATGLRRYGHDDLAREIARRWVATVERTYAETGLMFEKYDIEACAIGGGGEYAPQVGFGWTNGVTADFIDTL